MKTAVTHGRSGQTRNLDRWPVTAVMSRPAVALSQTASMAQALEAFVVTGLRHLAVIDAAGRCVGVLDDRMVAAAWAANPMTFSSVPVIASLDPLQPVILEAMTVADAARTMRKCGTDAVVVTDHRHCPIGVLTAGDLIAVLAKPH